MAIDFIKVDPTQAAATQARLLLVYKDTLRSAFELGTKILAIMGHNNDGTTFTNVETLFGLPSGTGQTVFNLINGSVGSMQGNFQVADAKTLTEKLG
jgi:hypothetical protein